eukprot:3065687-Pyramimonas_sp.AAC.1
MKAQWSFCPRESPTLPEGTEAFTPSNLRPLSITSADNRILGSAVRLHVQPIVAPEISLAQR